MPETSLVGKLPRSVKDHEQDITETTYERTRGTDPTIRQAARREIPMLTSHLALAEKAAKGV